MANWLSCKGWNMEHAKIDDIKAIMAIAEDETIIDKTLKFTALYVAKTSGKISWGKFEEVCINLGLLGDIENNLETLDALIEKRKID